jgi:hypothetical protein
MASAMGYVTVEQIRQQALGALKARVLEEDERAKKAKEAGVEFKRKYHMALFDTPEYKKWIDQRTEDMRRRGLLVTDRQLDDIRKGRRLEEGDKARYVGPDRLEPTRSGRQYTRKSGETGRIVQAVKGNDNLYIYTFMPDVPEAAKQEGGPDMFVATFQFKERTPAYYQVERIPKNNERS